MALNDMEMLINTEEFEMLEEDIDFYVWAEEQLQASRSWKILMWAFTWA